MLFHSSHILLIFRLMFWKKVLFAGFGFILFCSASVFAQPEIGGLGQNRDRRMEGMALRQSLFNTVAPMALGLGAVALFENRTVRTVGAWMTVYGLVIGPSTGNFYANDYARGGVGALVRFGGAVLLRNATSEVFGRQFANLLHVDDKSVSFGDTDVLIGSALLVGSIAYNIITGPVSVREYNRKMGYVMEMESLPGTGKVAPVLTARILL